MNWLPVEFRIRYKILQYRVLRGLVTTYSILVQVTTYRILVQVTTYRRHRIGRDGHLDQYDAHDIS